MSHKRGDFLMNKVFEILNVQPNITKSKIFKVDLHLSTKKIKTCISFGSGSLLNRSCGYLEKCIDKLISLVRISICEL